MTEKEAILKAVQELPDEWLSELGDYIESLQRRAVHQRVPTAVASEQALAKDWLTSEEDQAWQDL